MNEQEKIKFKNKLKQAGIGIIARRVEVAKAAVTDAQEAANSEEKSSAGDKYETGRSMGHLEIDMHGRQLAETQKELTNLQSVEINKIHQVAAVGTFVKTKTVSFFIAAGLGKQTVDNENIYFLSPHAPLAKLLIGKKTGDKFLFNNTQTTIVDLF